MKISYAIFSFYLLSLYNQQIFTSDKTTSPKLSTSQEIPINDLLDLKKPAEDIEIVEQGNGIKRTRSLYRSFNSNSGGILLMVPKQVENSEKTSEN